MRSIDNHKIIFEENRVSSVGILLIHGITSSKDEGGFYIDLSEILNRNSLSTFRFDFRGHGESDIPSKQITISGMIADLFESISYMENNYDNFSIVAASFGASIYLLLLNQLKPSKKLKSVIFLNPVTNYINTFLPEFSNWASSFFPKGGLHGLLTYNKDIKIGERFILNPIMGIEFFELEPNNVKWPNSIPLLILHGNKDSIVSINDSKAFKKNQKQNVHLIEFKNASHGLDENRNEVFREILKYIQIYNHE